MDERFRVLVEQTGVETVVSKEYYEKYAKEGIRFLGIWEGPAEAKETPPEVPVKEAPKQMTLFDTDPADMTYSQLKDACTIKGLTFSGNASKEVLIRLLEE